MTDPQRVLPVPGLPGGHPIPTVARVAALDFMLDELQVDRTERCKGFVRYESLTPVQADMLVDVVARDLEHDNLPLVLKTLGHYMDLTAAYRVVAILETEGT